ncbi:hypothetical protein Bcav_1642 [Beutenbergia cavernae DSM 12333]|uniref:YbaB/EbfC DNA-binding family protein n=1 Tax=Beutenbergia cavernae (strain ATCC BAA-8 / DSM 12333 / CCUG 43141 / JCM 11478 / NBRC 16432 / NCIMB 13614 / HKI 0122) TaxID=471853 RepID=C5C3Y5_BEUC1|nr:hypothetical protein [Beutenbergia cavernae]ACQ79898.1 hypothetical protein Bcav_1642 [Beutenbergia cavernae DSM 12333]
MGVDLDRIAEIRESLDRMHQVAEAVEAEGATAEATDVTGSVTVHVDKAGAISSVVVDADWPQHYEPEELGAVVCSTVRAADAGRLRTVLASVSERLRDSPPATRPMPPASDTLPGGLHAIIAEQPAGAVERRAAEQALKGLVDEVLRAVVDQRGRLESRRHARHDGGAQHGVVATTDGDGRLLDVAYDEVWLRGQSAFVLSLATREAIEHARTAARTTVASEVQAEPLSRLARDLVDPQAVARRLGLLTEGTP